MNRIYAGPLSQHEFCDYFKNWNRKSFVSKYTESRLLVYRGCLQKDYWNMHMKHVLNDSKPFPINYCFFVSALFNSVQLDVHSMDNYCWLTMEEA